MRHNALYAAAAMMATAAMFAAPSAPGYEPAPGEGRRSRPNPPYEPKTPTTEADHARVRLAEQKRARKAARQAKGMNS